MIQPKTFIKMIDNSGALVAECIGVMGGGRHASLGDEVVVVAKRVRPPATSSIS